MSDNMHASPAAPGAPRKQHSMQADGISSRMADLKFDNETSIDGKGPAHGPTFGVADPFTNTQFSPSAQPFQPGPTCKKPSPIEILSRYSEAEAGGPVIVKSTPSDHAAADNGLKPTKKSSAGAIGSGSRQASPKVKDTFTTDTGPGIPFRGGHYVKIERIDASTFQETYDLLRNEYQWESKIISDYSPELAEKQPSKYICLYICFDDVDDAAQAMEDMECVPPAQNWVRSYVSQTEYASKLSHDSGVQTSFFDGQVIFVARFTGTMMEINPSVVPGLVRRLAAEYGSVLAFDDGSTSSNVVEIRVEFAKITVANEVLSLITSAQPVKDAEWTIVARPVSPYPAAGYNTFPATPIKSYNGDRQVLTSPTGRTAWSVNQQGESIIEQPARTVPKVGNGIAAVLENAPYTPGLQRGRYQSAPIPQTPLGFDVATYGPRSESWTAGETVAVYRDTEPQCVNIDRIANGQDVRTTIMLRNVPNRWTAADLKQALDRCSAGAYDFSYLRIDFEYNTNVGYAFVNFTDPTHVIPFVETYVGKEWAAGTFPRKIAAVSYATVQGYDCLVEKFRNSAIMDEYPGFRPKLWYTEETAPEPSMIGEEKPFPAPNNQSKKQRSHDNAGTIGLWAPRTGHRRDGVRRSQYDRGTTRQIQEDAAFFNQASPGFGHQYIVDHGHGPVGAPAPPPVFTMPFYGGYPAYPPPQMPYGEGYAPAPYPAHAAQYYHPAGYPPPGTIVNPASKLRTISKGRLAGRPQNVSVDPAYYGGPVQFAGVPRSFGGEPDQRVAGQSNDARNYDNGAAFQYGQQ